uniref:E2 ubiquitin-conjugating enzyme n=1 Tax=Fundulus heteroclitus TaxID=8078 RepID=A0A3Q2NV04_FUNHE
MAQHGHHVASSQKALMLEMKSLQEEPVEGFKITLVDESDMYNWEVAIFGPPSTHYEGGYFKARIKFPVDYPYSPPAFRFLTKMWHPNIYENGDVCISILHPPVDDPQSGELPSERWNPTQNVRTILLSVISLLNEPNTFSPANVDASVMYRKWRDSKGKDREYIEIIRYEGAASFVKKACPRAGDSKLSFLPRFKGNRCCLPKRTQSGTESKFPPRWTNTACAPRSHPQTTAPTSYTTTTTTTRCWTKTKRKTATTAAITRTTPAPRTPDHASL